MEEKEIKETENIISNLNAFGNKNTPKSKKMFLIIQPNEKIIFKAKRTTLTHIIANLTGFVLLAVFWYFMGTKIFTKLGLWSIIVTIGVFLFLILETTDIFFFSTLILTNKRVIKRKYFFYSEILLDEIELLNSSQTLDFGTISILNKDGSIFTPPIIANPDNVKIEIEKYMKMLNNDKN